MIDKKDIIKMARHVFRRGRGIPDKRLLHPQREWTIGLFAFLILLIAGSSVSAQLFVAYQDLRAEGADGDIKVPKYNKSTVEAALLKYGEREGSFNMFRQEKAIAPVVESGEQATTTDATDADSIDIEDEGEVLQPAEESPTPVTEEPEIERGGDDPVSLEAN